MEHSGTSRNIPKHSGTSRIRANYHKINEKKERKEEKAIKETTENKRTNKQTKFKIRSNSSTFPPILSCDFLPCWFLGLLKKSGLSHIVTSKSYQICDKELDLQKN